MTPVTIERDEAGQTRPAPAIPDLTLPEFVLGAADRRGSKRALVDAATGQGISYSGLADAVREVGAGLSARGMRPGDVLALCAQNSIEFAVAWYAAASIGAIVTTVNPQCTGDEIARQLRQTGARWLGLPKSVELTHRNLVASLCQTWQVHQVAEDDVVMAALPLFHIYGLQITLNLALHAGATVIILPRFGLDPFLRAVEDHGSSRPTA
jgi:acyl-CoA synthetase (AMP-forming)/AMP-acid ligase II